MEGIFILASIVLLLAAFWLMSRKRYVANSNKNRTVFLMLSWVLCFSAFGLLLMTFVFIKALFVWLALLGLCATIIVFARGVRA